MSRRFHLLIVFLVGCSFSKLINSSAITVDDIVEAENTCTYTFNVLRDGSFCSDGGPSNSSFDALKSILTNQHALLEHQLNDLSRQISLITNVTSNTGANGRIDSNAARNESNNGVNENAVIGGTIYTKWGAASCPDTAELVYEGFTGKAHYEHGGGVNYLCMPRDPEHSSGARSGTQSNSYLYGTEYQKNGSPIMDQALNDDDVPCAVCEVSGRTRYMMIPAKQSCPPAWTKEYQGLLMAQYYTQKGSDFICVAEEMETLAGGYENKDAGLLYVVESRCGSLKCPPYVDGYELSCVVCTK